MEKILFVINDKFMKEDKLNTLYRDKIELLKSNDNFDTINIYDKIDISPRDYSTILFNWDSIYLYKKYFKNDRIMAENNFNKLLEIKNKFIILENMHPKTYKTLDDLCDVLNSNKFNIIFTYDKNSESKYIKRRTMLCKHFYIPHHINTDKFKQHDGIDEKNIDILLFGASNQIHYPFTNRLFKLILQNKHLFNIKYICFPNNNLENNEKETNTIILDDDNYHEYIGEKLSMILNKTKITIITKSKYNYLSAKYFEAAASKCIIAGDLPNCKEIFENNTLELNDEMDDDELLMLLKYYVNNYNYFNENLNNLQKIICNEYNLNKYLDKILNIIKENTKQGVFSICVYNELTHSNNHYKMILDMLITKTPSHKISYENIIKNKNNFEEYLKYKYNSLPKYIILYNSNKVYDYIDIFTSTSKVILIMEDVHYANSVAKNIIPVIKKVHMCLCPYAYEFNRWNYPVIQNNFLYPHCAIYLHKYNSNPIKKVLLSGKISKIYPERQYVMKLAKEYPDNFDVLPVVSKNSDDLKQGFEYYKYLNNYLCCIVDSSRDYVYSKVFEICAVGSLLLCVGTGENTKDIFEKLGFISGYNYIYCDKSNLIEKVNWILDFENILQINEIRLKGQELIMKSHTIINRYNSIIDILTNKNLKSYDEDTIRFDDRNVNYKLGYKLCDKTLNNLPKIEKFNEDINCIKETITNKYVEINNEKEEERKYKTTCEINLDDNKNNNDNLFSLIIFDNFKNCSHFNYIFKSIINNTNSKFVTLNELRKNKNDLKNFFLKKYLQIPRYILCYNRIEEFNAIIIDLNLITKVVFFQDDIFKNNNIMLKRQDVYEKTFACFSTYKYLYHLTKMPKILNHYYLPHCSSYILPINNKPIKKILLVGKMKSPIIFLIKNILFHHKNLYDVLEYNDEYISSDGNQYLDKDYYKYLNKYLCCLVDTSFDYVLPKVFETCGAGSLLLLFNNTNEKIFSDLGFVDNVNCMSCNKMTLVDMIKWILDEENSGKIDLMRKNGQRLINEKHTVEIRTNMIMNVLNNN